MSKKDSDLCSRNQALPNELQDQILEFLIKISINPGKVYFGHTIGINVFPGLLKIPNPALQKKAIAALFANNTWVMPQGEAPEAELLTQLPFLCLLSIRSMELAFSWKDAWSFSLGGRLTFINNGAAERCMKGWPAGKLGREIMAGQYQLRCSEWTHEACRIWNNKYELLRVLPLEHLRLDFTAAYDAEDRFLGRWLASLLFRPFRFGAPPHLEIVAPTAEIEIAIRDIVGTTNRDISQNRVCSMCQTGTHVTEINESDMEKTEFGVLRRLRLLEE